MKIAIITYNISHRKTQELLVRLKAKGYKEVIVYAIPFIKRKPYVSVYAHRPTALLIKKSLQEVCKNFNYLYQPVTIDQLNLNLQKEAFDYILLAGAGLLPETLVSNNKIINSHPGYLPYVRGLDALKWAIYDKKPLGVTLHFIDKNADAGQLIYQEKLKLQPLDTFSSLASKIWELEMNLLANSIEISQNKTDLAPLSTKISKSKRRMPKSKELLLEKKVKEYLQHFNI